MPSVTVIIPTLELATPVTDRLVHAIQASSAVARVIFINNVRQDSYSSRYADHRKVEVVTHMPNLMVNPAWNYGMSLCDTKYYLLLNDDLVMSRQIIDGITKILDTRDDLNLFTVRTVVDYDLDRIDRQIASQPPIEKIEFDIRRYPDGVKQGWFMLGRTDSWLRIEVNKSRNRCYIMGGDDFVYEKNQLRYAGAGFVKNSTIYHCESSSVHLHSGNPGEIERLSKPFDPYLIPDYV